MLIYFCGSIRGGRELADTYAEIIKDLRSYGEVLTEHVAEPLVQDHDAELLSDLQIYERDRSWLEESDCLVAEVSLPSLGVGYEIGYAVRSKKPVLCLYRKDSAKQLSAMISGCPDVVLAEYSNVGELSSAFSNFFNSPGHPFP